MTNILVTGANGQLGSELRDLAPSHSLQGTSSPKAVIGDGNLYPDYNFTFTTREELDVTSKQSIEAICAQKNINVIINCAAYTAVDKAESEPEQADLINHLAVKYIAEVAKEKNIAVIHISTDYVFDGTNHKPYVETDPTNPQSVYGQSKLDGENALRQINPANSIIIRTSWLYSSYGNNFVKTMLKLGKERDELNVVADQIGSPTYARDLAGAILHIIPQLNNNVVEIYHYSNEGVCSWYDFAKAIFEVAEIECKVNAIPSSAYPTPALRPFYSVMNKQAFKEQYKQLIPNWRDSLKTAIAVEEIIWND